MSEVTISNWWQNGKMLLGGRRLRRLENTEVKKPASTFLSDQMGSFSTVLTSQTYFPAHLLAA